MKLLQTKSAITGIATALLLAVSMFTTPALAGHFGHGKAKQGHFLYQDKYSHKKYKHAGKQKRFNQQRGSIHHRKHGKHYVKPYFYGNGHLFKKQYGKAYYGHNKGFSKGFSAFSGRSGKLHRGKNFHRGKKFFKH